MLDLISADNLILPPTADFHCHLRQDAMMRLVAPRIRAGGANVVYVMPNLQPPITTVSQAIAYHKKLSQVAPDVLFLMSLYLHPTVTPEVIEDAAKSKIIYGVKLYPAGVTTNSQEGVLNIEMYYPVFEAMQVNDLILNIHGESCDPSATRLDAESRFLPQLRALHEKFPELRIVLEHVSTRDGLEAVRACGSTVRGSITAHHLYQTTEDAERDIHFFCKPIAKTLDDRKALLQAVTDGSSKFFFGSDSAPHDIQSKNNGAAGCFTSPWSTPTVIGALQDGLMQGWINMENATQEAIEGFLSGFGRAFYKLPDIDTRSSRGPRIRLEKRGERIPNFIKSDDGKIELIPFRRGEEVMTVSWIE